MSVEARPIAAAIAAFASREDAAVTVDWVVLTAAVVGLTVAGSAAVVSTTRCEADRTGDAVGSADVVTTLGSGQNRSSMRASRTSIDGGGDACRVGEATYVKYGDVDGPSDLSGGYQVRWDEDGLTVTVAVTDDVVADNPDNRHNWQNDSVEVYLDMEGDGGSRYNDDDFQFVVGTRGDDDVDLHRNGGRDRVPPGVKTKVERTGDGYTATLRADWASLNMDGPPPKGTEIGFAIGINDSDDASDRTRAAIMVGTDSPNGHHGPGGFNRMKLD